MKYALLIFSTVLFLSIGCTKKKNESVLLRFEIPLSVTPIKDSIELGDAIFLKADFPDTLKDINEGKSYRFKNFNFQTSIGFYQLNSALQYLVNQPGNTAAYSFKSESGSISNVTQSFSYLNFVYTDSSYVAKIYLIPNKKGVYNLLFFSRLAGHNTTLDFIDIGKTESGGDKIATLTNLYLKVNNGDTNYELLKQNCKLGSVISPTPENIRAEKEATFTFVVK